MHVSYTKTINKNCIAQYYSHSFIFDFPKVFPDSRKNNYINVVSTDTRKNVLVVNLNHCVMLQYYKISKG